MDKKDDLLRRPLYLYGLPAEVLDTLAYKDVANAVASEGAEAVSGAGQTEPAPETETDTRTGPSTLSASGQACSLCSQSFSTVADQRGHLKSDLHHYNLKQKMRGLAPVTEAAFERLAENLDESLSGSDSSESESDDEAKSDDAGGGNVLAALLKRQAVLAEKKRRTAEDDDDDDDDTTRGAPRRKDKSAALAAASIRPLVWFSSPVLAAHTYFGVYRAMLTAEELAGEPDKKLVAAIRSRQLAAIGPGVGGGGSTTATGGNTYAGRHVFLCMIGGGHFAAMVVALAPRRAKAGSLPMNREATVLAHKTFHRYTTRRKQGGAQSASDAAKGAAHSAGSTLRRYNEQALVDDVRALLQEWKPLLDTAELLFVRATGTTNQRTLFGPYEGQVLHGRDARLRGFPFNTRRPTQKEIMRAFIELTRLKVREIVREVAEAAPEAGPGPKTAPKAAPKDRPARNEQLETALLHTAQLQALARRSKVPALLAYLQANGLSAATFRFAPADSPQHHHAPTLLHLAASQNAPALVSALLVRAGADPTARNADDKTAFELAGDRATRDAFRVSRAERGEDVWDWDAAARVPPPMTRADADARDAREKQEAARQETARRRAEEARLKAEAAKARRTDTTTTAHQLGVAKSAQEIRDEQTRGLTPQQRMRLERERRARAAEERMRRMQQ